MMRLRDDAPQRGVADVGAGDFVKVFSGAWEEIVSNSAEGVAHPRQWTIVTKAGARGMYDVRRYAKAEDFEDEPGAFPPERRHGVDDDLRALVALALDLHYYRGVRDDGGLGHCAWIELRDAVRKLPEASE